jgi:DNA-binding response OmpR family regulator
MNILLVDDERKFAMMLAKRLDLRGFQVHFVYTGTDAIEMVKKGERFDVAVLDVKMPGIGGIELRRELQRLDPDMKFVFLTGHGSNNDYAVGAREAALYLPKPLKINELVEALLRVTGTK